MATATGWLTARTTLQRHELTPLSRGPFAVHVDRERGLIVLEGALTSDGRTTEPGSKRAVFTPDGARHTLIAPDPRALLPPPVAWMLAAIVAVIIGSIVVRRIARLRDGRRSRERTSATAACA